MVDAIILHTEGDFFWFTNISLFFGFIIITKNKICCLFDARDELQITNLLKSKQIELMCINPIDINKILKKQLKELKISHVAVSEFTSLGDKLNVFKNIDIKECFNSYDLRSIKTNEEINKLQKSADVACAGMAMLKKYIKPGITEKQATQKLLNFFINNGATASSFNPIILFGDHSAFIHSTTTDRKYVAGENILADIGCIVDGYCSDLTRCWGSTNKEIIKMQQIVTKANKIAISKVRANIKAGEIDKAARQIISEYKKQNFGHSTGHGVGIYIHEHPIINQTSNHIIHENNVFTVEPGIYIEGLGGIRIEDTVVATKTGCIVLTKKAPK